MMKVFSAAFALLALGLALGLAAPLAPVTPARADAASLDAPAYAGKGDWRRHQVVRTWRDEGGCRVSVISYHHPDGVVETRESRDCGKE